MPCCIHTVTIIETRLMRAVFHLRCGLCLPAHLLKRPGVHIIYNSHGRHQTVPFRVEPLQLRVGCCETREKTRKLDVA
jgi:hypothetical protein